MDRKYGDIPMNMPKSLIPFSELPSEKEIIPRSLVIFFNFRTREGAEYWVEVNNKIKYILERNVGTEADRKAS